MAQNCGNCKFSKRIDENTGHCRRHPPAVHRTSPNGFRGHYPVVRREDTCGEWEAKPA